MHDISFADILTIFRRRRAYFLAIALPIAVLVILFALTWSRYEATALVEIKQSYVPQSVTNMDGNNSANSAIGLADRRINLIQQRVTSSESLSEIITKLDLYPGANKTAPLAKLSKQMRDNIHLNFVSSSVSNPAAAQKESVEQLSAIAFEISFTYSDPELTKQALDEIVHRFIEEDTSIRQLQAAETNDFLNQEIESLEDAIKEKEQRIADFRSKYGESGPSAILFNQQATMSNTQNLQNTESQFATNEALLGTLRGQIATTDPYLPTIKDGDTIVSPTTRLRTLQAQLASLTGRYGPEHPDVVNAREEIEALKSQGITTSTKKIIRDADNPSYMQLAAQISALESQQRALRAQRANLEQQKRKYEAMLEKNPSIEQQMSELTLDLDNSKERYRELKSKKLAAEMKEKLENGINSERLHVIDAPTLPEGTTPPRLILALMGFALAIASGIAAVIIAETLGQSIRSMEHLTRLVGAAPLVHVPCIENSLIQPSDTASLLSTKAKGKNVASIDTAHPERRRIPRFRANSKEADTFRILRTQILQMMAQGGMKTLGITSPNYGDGKTTVALNLAFSIALDLKQTVLLVDLDLRKPDVMSYLGLSTPYGLSDYFQNNVPISDCLTRLSLERLSILPAGSNLEQSSEVLGSPKIAALAQELKTRYADRLIIYDLPPMLEQDDPLVFAPQMDGILLVVNEGFTSVQDLKTTMHRLGNANIIGTVLNDSQRHRNPNLIERIFGRKKRPDNLGHYAYSLSNA